MNTYDKEYTDEVVRKMKICVAVEYLSLMNESSFTTVHDDSDLEDQFAILVNNNGTTLECVRKDEETGFDLEFTKEISARDSKSGHTCTFEFEDPDSFVKIEEEKKYGLSEVEGYECGLEDGGSIMPILSTQKLEVLILNFLYLFKVKLFVIS